jgi:hypothetical protein
MSIKTILPFVVTLAISIWPSAHAGEAPKPANAGVETGTEAKAKVAYDVAEKAAKEAEAAVAPLKAAMQRADTAYAEASKAANAKRQQATDAKNLAGDSGAAELKQAEANLPAAIKALTDATNAKPPLDKALADAKAVATPLQQAYDAAEKAAKEAEAVAKVALDAANKLDDEAKKATAQAVAQRRVADSAKAALARARQGEQNLQNQAGTAATKLTVATGIATAAEAALASTKNQVAAATTVLAAAEKAAQDAAAKAKQVAADASKPVAEKKQTAEEAAAKRKVADAAKTALAQAQAAQQKSLSLANAAAQKLARATAQKKAVEAGSVSVKNQIAAAATASAAAEKADQDVAKVAEGKKLAAAQAAAKRKAAVDAATALAQARQGEQNLQNQATAAAKALSDATGIKKAADAALANVKNQVAAATTASAAAETAAREAAAKAKQISADAAKPDAEKKQATADVAAKRKAADAAKAALAQVQQSEQAAQAQATAAAQKLAAAEAQKKAADAAPANAKNQVTAATAANQAAQTAAKEVIQLDTASKQAAEAAAAKRKAADAAKAVLAPAQQKLEQAAIQANAAAQQLAQGQARKKSAEEGLADLKKRIAAAKQTHLADEQVAKAAEAVAAPLKVEADRTRAAHAAAMKVADDKRALAEQAKADLYRLVAARQVTNLMESSDPPVPANRIDEIVFAKLKALGIKPALCSDAVFVRRAYLDLTGKLPSAEEAKTFIRSSDKNKRAALIGRLLDQPAHVDYWAMKWSDILRVKAEFPVKVWPNAAQAYYRWVWESIAQNKPYDQFARELLTSSGSNFRVGPVNFYRAIQEKTPEGITAAVGVTLMGTRVHLWPEARRAGMAAFFSQVGYKPTSEWKEEIVFWDPLHSVAVPGSTAPGIDAVANSVTVTNQIPQALAKPLSENGPLAAVFPDGTKTTIPAGRDPREAFADWLIRPENPWFARAIVDRTWAWVMGRGIIHEADDIRENNPPSNPELLAYLQNELVQSHYDLKHLTRLMFTSTTYQFSSIPRIKGPEARANFASYLLRRVEAEVLIDALNNITGSSDLYTSAVPEPFSYIPNDMSAVALADGSVTSSFLALFGRSSRSTGMEGERVNELASTQWLYMLNSGQIQNKLQSGPKLAAMLAAGGKTNEIAERLYLTILSRFPMDADVKAVEEYAKTGVTNGHDVWIDLAWALINSPEFLLRH